MASKEKLKLRKELDKFHAPARQWTRQELSAGVWLPKFLEVQLASHLGGKSPPELKTAFPDAESEEDLVEEVTNKAIHRAIAATDAYKESLTGTEIRNFKERSTKGKTKLSGDAVALIAELLYVVRLCIDLMFDVSSAHGRVFSGGEVDLIAEIFGRSLSHFDVDEAKESDDFQAKVGAQIFSRAVTNTVGTKMADALRKGFYCFFTKAIAENVPDYIEGFDEWAEPKPETGPMLAVDPDEAGALGY